MPHKNNRNWANVNVSFSEDDAVYLIGIISSDIGAMAFNRDKWAMPMQRAQRTRQKLQDALRARRAHAGTKPAEVKHAS